MDNVCCIEYFSGGMAFKFNFVSYLYQKELMYGDTKFAASEIIRCTDDEYKAIVNFLKSKDETYLELEQEK